MNIIYIICHDLGKHLGCYDLPIESPNLDKFAQDGLKFTNAFCASPACSPSRGCAMTGKYAHRNGLMGLVNGGWSMPEETNTIVDYLNDAGYKTVHFGLSHERHPMRSNRYEIDEEGGPETRFVENVVDKGITYLKNNIGKEKPFYLNLGFQEVHASLWKKDGWIDRTPLYGIDMSESVYIPPHMPDTDYYNDWMRRFQGAIKHMDKHLKRLFDAIEEFGYYKNTLVVFLTDHGIAGYRSKGTLYDSGLETTLLMRLPDNIKRKGIVSGMFSNIDIMPTLLDACNIKVPDDINGISFWKQINENNQTLRNEVYAEKNWDGGTGATLYDPIRAIRNSNFHYIRNFGKDMQKDAEELFDVINDPGEFYNLANDAKYVDIRKDLSEKLQKWMEQTNDPLLNGDIPEMKGEGV